MLINILNERTIRKIISKYLEDHTKMINKELDKIYQRIIRIEEEIKIWDNKKY